MKYFRNEYPRPQFRREKWQTLNGEWQFDFDDDSIGELKGYPTGAVALSKTINVPFTYQTKASGIGDVTHHQTVWYRRKFTYNPKDKNALLCFNASDYQTDVFINGHHAVSHVGGFAPFSQDVTKYLNDGENVIVVKCVDPLDNYFARGKQSATGSRYGCWYIPNTGIWQSVWIEYFDGDYVENYSLFCDIDTNKVWGTLKTCNGVADSVQLKVSFCGEQVLQQSYTLQGKFGNYCFEFENQPHLWDIENPNLYDVTMSLYKDGKLLDSADLRFGMRKFAVENGVICLNHKPIYQRLILDQGYWCETSITPPSAEAIKRDIQMSIDMGFNGARKHQKFEDPYFYYYADEMGFLTWCEMPSGYRFCEEEVRNVTDEWLQILKIAKNFTSVVTYVLLNESWGVDGICKDKYMQHFANSLYYATLSVDQSRLISINDGWENMNLSDFYSLHDYAYDDAEFKQKYVDGDWNTIAPSAGRKFLAEGQSYQSKPIIFSEFGGIAMQVDQDGEAWGYGEGAKDNGEIYKRIRCLVEGIAKIPVFQGFCYTQLSDVEQEVNGLLDENHNPKFDIKTLKGIFRG